MPLEQTKSSLETCDGIDLYCEKVVPDWPSSVVILVHGYGEHSGLYLDLVHSLATSVDSVVHNLDLRGHGRSPGERGHYSSIGDCLDELDLLIVRANQQNPRLPLFLIGHNLGALLCVLAIKRGAAKVAGIALSGLSMRVEVPTLFRMMKPFQILLSAFRYKSSIHDYDTLGLNKDELTHNAPLSLDLAIELQDQLASLQSAISDLKEPVLVFCQGHEVEIKDMLSSAMSYEVELNNQQAHIASKGASTPLSKWLDHQIRAQKLASTSE